MASGGSGEIRKHGDINQSRGAHFERVADEFPINVRLPPDANDPNGQVGRDFERVADEFPINMRLPPDANDPNGQVGRDFERSPPGFLVYSGLMQIEGGILQVHSQGSSPFTTHPAIMWTYLFSLFTCYGAALYYGKCWLRGSRSPRICELVGTISGSLSSAAFVAILVAPSFEFELLVFLVWILHLLIYFKGARDWILKVAKKLYAYFSNGAIYVQNIWNGILKVAKKLYGYFSNGAIYVQNIWNGNSGSKEATNPQN